MTKRSSRSRSSRRAAATKVQKTKATTTPAARQEPAGSSDSGSSNLYLYGGIAVVLIVLVLVWLFATPWSPLSSSDSGSAEKVISWAEPPAMSIDASKQYFATIKTELGDIRLELYADKAPMTVNNLVFLARQGYYDDTTFHRVMDGFMAQAGDPTGTGSGGPGYTFPDEFNPDLGHAAAGILSMANRGTDTNGGQFFITYAPQPHLDGKHTVFGKVVSGMDVVESLAGRSPTDDIPATKIETIEIEEL
jgi:cyclophilin family peptidyl-prolyl cis-trans isomerase